MSRVGAGSPPIRRVRTVAEFMWSGRKQVDPTRAIHCSVAGDLAVKLGLSDDVRAALGSLFELGREGRSGRVVRSRDPFARPRGTGHRRRGGISSHRRRRGLDTEHAHTNGVRTPTPTTTHSCLIPEHRLHETRVRSPSPWNPGRLPSCRRTCRRFRAKHYRIGRPVQARHTWWA